MVQKALREARELIPVFFVAVGVALLSTLAGSVLDRVHQVDAEAFARENTSAKPNGDHRQVLVIKEWGLQVALPLAAEMPLLNYTSHGSSSIGLSSAGLAQYGPVCSAGRNALGTVIRYAPGTYDLYPRPSVVRYYLGRVGEYDYGYELPQPICAQAAGKGLVNQQTSVLREALGGLSPDNLLY